MSAEESRDDRLSPDQLALWCRGRWTAPPAGPISGFTLDTRGLRPASCLWRSNRSVATGTTFWARGRRRGGGRPCRPHSPGGGAAPVGGGDPQEAFQTIAAQHRRTFAGPVIGISGSAGKTSTKDLVAVLLGGAPGVLATEGNLNNHLGVPLTLTRLDPAVHRFAVVEAGISQPGEMKRLAAMIQPDLAIITLVAPAHLEELGDLEAVGAKRRTCLRWSARPALRCSPGIANSLGRSATSRCGGWS